MLRAIAFSLLGLTLLASPALAQTAPARKAAARPRPAANASSATRTTDRVPGTTSAKGQSDYAAPGQPIIPPTDNGKNTPPYDGPAAGHGQAKKSTTLAPK